MVANFCKEYFKNKGHSSGHLINVFLTSDRKCPIDILQLSKHSKTKNKKKMIYISTLQKVASARNILFDKMYYIYSFGP